MYVDNVYYCFHILHFREMMEDKRGNAESLHTTNILDWYYAVVNL